MTTNLQELVPVDIELSKIRNISDEYVLETDYNKNLQIDSKRTIEESLALLDFNIHDYFKDITDVYTYADVDFGFEDTLGSTKELLKEKYPFFIFFFF